MSDQTDKTKAPGLLDEPPILVYPSLACKIGINAAVVLQQLHYLINATKKGKNTHNLIDDQWWVYNTYKEWHEDYFPWLAERTIQGIFLDLEKQGIIKSRQSVKNKSDRRKWYTIDYEAWRKLYATITQNLHDDDAKSAPSTITQNLHDGYSENTETTSDILSTAPQNGATHVSSAGGSDVTTDGAVTESPASVLPDTPKKERARDPWYDAIAETMGAQGFRNGRIKGVLLASGKGEYAKYNLAEALTDPQEVRDFWVWFKKTCEGCSLTSPATVQDWVMRWQQTGKSRPAVKPEPISVNEDWQPLDLMPMYGAELDDVL